MDPRDIPARSKGEDRVPGALEGVNVIDLSWGRPGPFATGQMADHGAEVIRLEPPGGDPYRSMVARPAYDRGKRSMTLDLTRTAGIEIVHRLLADADVLVESFQPGVAERMGLGFADLHPAYPRLVYCSISAYGREGPDRDRPGYESLVAARMGLMARAEEPEGDPVYPGVPIGSIGAGLLAVIGTLAALVEREDTGVGQHVDTSILDGVLSFTNMWWEDLENLPDAPLAPSNRRLFFGSVECADGEWLGVHTGANGSHARLMEALGLSERVKPAPGNREKTVPLSPEEYQIITVEAPRIFASRPRAFWLDRLVEHDVCAIPVLRQGEALFEPQTTHNALVVELDDPEVGRVAQVGVAGHLAATPGRIRGPAPRVGEQTEQILVELGYDEEAIRELRLSGVLGQVTAC
jgi:crotonobetainyl-CoA:carnitine CoA-transferase CaiB-like acyl-CoA transferase